MHQTVSSPQQEKGGSSGLGTGRWLPAPKPNCLQQPNGCVRIERPWPGTRNPRTNDPRSRGELGRRSSSATPGDSDAARKVKVDPRTAVRYMRWVESGKVPLSDEFRRRLAEAVAERRRRLVCSECGASGIDEVVIEG
jgi:hypothetical protein